MKSDYERLMEKVQVTDGCWLWIAALFKTGYGAFRLNGRAEYAHRASYIFHVGPGAKGSSPPRPSLVNLTDISANLPAHLLQHVYVGHAMRDDLLHAVRIAVQRSFGPRIGP